MRDKREACLYYGDRPLTSVLVEGATSDEEVIRRALRIHEGMPTLSLNPGETPYEFRLKLQRAHVRYFD